MRQVPLTRHRKFHFNKLFFALLALPFLFSSCVTDRDREEVSGSVDFTNEHETGPSAIGNNSDPGINVMCGIWTSLPQNTDFHGDDADRDYLPKAYAPSQSDGHFYLGSHLEFAQKGSKFAGAKTRLDYLEIVEDGIYGYTMPDKGLLFGGLGPYIGYGIGGSSGTGSFKTPSFGGTDGYKRFDAGLHLTAGYRLPAGVFVALGYEWGLVNKSPEPDFTSRNRAFSINVGYSFSDLFHAGKKK